jgi:hypothetical protein
MIRIKRDAGYADRIRAYKIVLDDNVIGEIKNGEQVELNAPPGKHQLFLKIDWCSSNTINFESDTNTTEFECGSNLRGWKILLGVLYTTFLRNQYIWLRKVEFSG